MTFSHDGLRDSLTQLAAPPFLYESLRREISRSDRESTELSLLRFLLDIDILSIDIGVIHFADILEKSFRNEDLVARVGKYEFVVLVKGDGAQAKRLGDRFYENWKRQGPDSLSSWYSCATRFKDESALDFLNRLDQEQLNRPLL